MHLRFRNILPLVVVCLALAVAPAFAARPAPSLVPMPGGALPSVDVTSGASATCALGQTGPGVSAFIWFFPSDDYYYTYFDPAACQCAGGITNLVVNWQLFWPTPCSIDVQAWILPSVNPTGGCDVPDTAPSPPNPAAPILCGPGPITTITGAATGVPEDHLIPLPDCLCLSSAPGFILVKIVGNQNCPVRSDGALGSPAIVVDNTPGPCTSYNAFAGSGGPIDMLTFGFPGNNVMWVNADCCPPTPTLPGSWGMLKTLYR